MAADPRETLQTALRGAVPMYRRAQTAGSVVIDRAIGVQTTERNQKVEWAPTGARPFGWTQIARLFHRYPLGPDDVLVDVGSGAGRVVLFGATRFACRRIIGVERDARLDSIARRNVRALRLRARTPIELVHGDAVEFDVPDDVSVVFFFNPFEGEPFDELVTKLTASIDRSPRRLRFVYANPRSAAVLAEHPRFALVDQIRSWRPDPAWARSCAVNVYDVVQEIDLAAVDVAVASPSPV